MSNTVDSKTRTQEFWDQNPCGSADTWERARDVRFAVTDTYLEGFLSGPTLRGKDVLEIGCGQGLDASRIVEQCNSYVGIDLSDESVQIARHEVGRRKPESVNAEFLQGDAENLPFPDKSFEAVYSIGVLHHTENFDQAMNEINRLLKRDGTLVLMLYRSYTPLWVVLRVVRGTLRIPLFGARLRNRVLNAVRKKSANDTESIAGTAIHELVGCPIIDTYTYRGLRKKIGPDYEVDNISFHRTGIDQVVRILPRWLRKRWPQASIEKVDGLLSSWLGFYLFMVATKRGEDV